MTLDDARVQMLSLLTAAFSLVVGVLWMCWPPFWLRRRLNPRSDIVVFDRSRDALAFRIDMISQNVLQRPMLRQQWVEALIRTSPPQPRSADVLPVPELRGASAARTSWPAGARTVRSCCGGSCSSPPTGRTGRFRRS